MGTNLSVVAPDFEVFTGAITPSQKDVSGKALFTGLPLETDESPHVFMVGSSTEQDLHGDTMMPTALADMAATKPGLSLFLNHDYTLPYSYFGTLLAAPVIVNQDGVADLHLASNVALKNVAAADTYMHIKDGAQFGCSGGFQILEYAFDGDDWFAPLMIYHVQALEWSVVGIPANQRSWVEKGIGGLFKRMIREDRGEEALKLAPAFKSLYRNDYKELVKSLTSDGLRKDLEASPVRPSSPDRLTWEPLTKTFILQRNGKKVATVKNVADAMAQLSIRIKKDDEESMRGTVKKEEAQPEREVEETPEQVEEEQETTEETQVEETPEQAEVEQKQAPQFDEEHLIAMLKKLGVTPAAAALPSQDEINSMMVKAWEFVLATKAGAAFSKENKSYIKTIHDAINSMIGNEFCASVMDDGSEDDESQMEEQDAAQVDFTPVMDELNTLKGIFAEVPAQLNKMVETFSGIPMLQAHVSVLTKAASELDSQFKQAQSRVNAINDDLNTLTNRPLGKPTHLNTKVAPVSDMAEATYEEMLSVNKDASSEEPFSGTLEDALKQTEKRTRALLDGREVVCRYWPKGVGGTVEDGVRPALTVKQKGFMPVWAWAEYALGEDALVPLIDDQFPNTFKTVEAR